MGLVVVRDEVESAPFRWMTRAGLALNGVLHLLVATLALQVAGGSRARADQAGALQAVAAHPFGWILVWLVAGGFSAVVLWRVREAIWGFRHVEDDHQRLSKRGFSLLQAAVFTGLAGLAIRVASGGGAGSGGEGPTAAVLRLPAGRWIIVAIGAVVLVSGLVMGLRGWKLSFTEDMDLGRASPRARMVVERAGQFGSLAKGVAFMVIGVLVAQAGFTSRPERAEGLDAALKTVAAAPYGPWALIAVGGGLASFGLFCFFDARYHRV